MGDLARLREKLYKQWAATEAILEPDEDVLDAAHVMVGGGGAGALIAGGQLLMTLTHRRILIVGVGALRGVRTIDISLEHVQSVAFDKGAFGAPPTQKNLLTISARSGTTIVSFNHAAKEGPDWPSRILAAQKASGRPTAGESDSPSGSHGIVEQLERLSELRATGALTDDEFIAAKRRIVSG